MADNKTFMVEDAQILFRNFKGEAGQFNAEGKRTFAVILEPDVAEAMLEDGWNVKYLKPREEDSEVGDPYISVTVKFDIRPPRVVMISSNARTTLDEETVGELDNVDIAKADLIARAYDWEMQATGKTGRTAYLQSLFVTIEEDALERKYAYYEHLEDEEGE